MFFIVTIFVALGIGLGISVGFLIGVAAAALYHYWEKTSVPVNSNVVDNPEKIESEIGSSSHIQNSEQIVAGNKLNHDREDSVLQASYTSLLALRGSVVKNPGIDIDDTPTSLADFIQKAI